MSREGLTEEAVSQALAELPGWAFADGMLHRELRFADFSEAWGFMNRVAQLPMQHPVGESPAGQLS